MKNKAIKILGIGAVVMLLSVMFIPVIAEAGCSCDPSSWTGTGYWKTVKTKVYLTTSPFWHGFWGGHIDGLDAGGYYYWEYTEVWVKTYTGILSGDA